MSRSCAVSMERNRLAHKEHLITISAWGELRAAHGMQLTAICCI